MIQLSVVVHIQGCVSHADVAEGEAGLVVGRFACVADGCVGRLVAQWIVVGLGRVSGGWLVDGEG